MLPYLNTNSFKKNYFNYIFKNLTGVYLIYAKEKKITETGSCGSATPSKAVSKKRKITISNIWYRSVNFDIFYWITKVNEQRKGIDFFTKTYYLKMLKYVYMYVYIVKISKKEYPITKQHIYKSSFYIYLTIRPLYFQCMRLI